MNSVAADDRHSLAESEEARVKRALEADVIGGETPTHDAGIEANPERQKTVNKWIVETGSVIGDGEERARWARLHLEEEEEEEEEP